MLKIKLIGSIIQNYFIHYDENMQTIFKYGSSSVTSKFSSSLKNNKIQRFHELHCFKFFVIGVIIYIYISNKAV